MSDTITLNINREPRQANASGDRTLLSVLRDDFGLTGTKYGCGEGQCGSCTVHIDGSPTRACITLVADCAERQITTIEGLERDDTGNESSTPEGRRGRAAGHPGAGVGTVGR